MNTPTAQSILAKLREGLDDALDVEGDEELPHVPFEERVVLTGKRARQQEADLHKRFLEKGDEGGEFFLPFSRRARRRATQAQAARQRRRGQRAYTRNELAKERAANDVAHIFNVLDRILPTDHTTFERFQDRLEARIEFLIREDTTRFVREAAEREDPESNPPQPILTRDEAVARLRAVAKTAVIPLRGSARTKANRARKREVLDRLALRAADAVANPHRFAS